MLAKVFLQKILALLYDGDIFYMAGGDLSSKLNRNPQAILLADEENLIDRGWRGSGEFCAWSRGDGGACRREGGGCSDQIYRDLQNLPNEQPIRVFDAIFFDNTLDGTVEQNGDCSK